MELFAQRLIDGLTNGAIYASLALAISLIYKSTGLLNFAQGEMGMFSTYVVLVLSTSAADLAGTGVADNFVPGHPWPVWVAIIAAILIAMVFGALIERGLIRSLEGRSTLAVVNVTVGLLFLLNATASRLWTTRPRDFPTPFPSNPEDFISPFGDVRIRLEAVGIWLTLLAVLGAIYLMLRFTKVGLAFRAVSSNRETSGFVGIRVGRTIMFGWAIAAGMGALAGALVANNTFLQPSFMLRLLFFSLAAATLGGLDSPFGSVVGGIIIGLAQSMLGYVPLVGSEMALFTSLIVVLAVLLIRPTGLFGTRRVTRV